MILVAYRHGLRVSELVDLRWDQVDPRTATLRVRTPQALTLLWAMSYEHYDGSSANSKANSTCCA
jgi:integrase